MNIHIDNTRKVIACGIDLEVSNLVVIVEAESVVRIKRRDSEEEGGNELKIR